MCLQQCIIINETIKRLKSRDKDVTHQRSQKTIHFRETDGKCYINPINMRKYIRCVAHVRQLVDYN